MTITLNGTTGITTPADTVTGNATVGGTLNVTGATALSSTLSVTGTTTLTGAATLTGGIAGDVTATGTVAMASSFKRNRIINGNMLIDQRNAGASVTPANIQYLVDRWQVFVSQSSKFTAQQNAGSVTPPSGFTNYLGITSSSAYSIVASDYFTINQRIEGFNVSDLAYGTAGAKTTTLSFWVYSSLTGSFGGAFANSAQTRAYTFNYTISAANTWTQISVTIPGDTSGTWVTNNGIGLFVVFGLGVGSTYTTAANSWATGAYLAPTSNVSVVGTSGATFYITGVQLEVGTKATPYEMQIYSDQLAQCQRYAYVATLGCGGYGTSGIQITAYNGYPVTMRATPTLSGSSITYGNASGLSFDTITATRFRQVWTVSGNGGTDVTYTLTATAEL